MGFNSGFKGLRYWILSGNNVQDKKMCSMRLKIWWYKNQSYNIYHLKVHGTRWCISYMIKTYEPQNLISSLIFDPVGHINYTNTHNYHSHLPKWCITNLKIPVYIVAPFSAYRLTIFLYMIYSSLQTIFLYMIYSSLLDRYQTFGGMCCLHHCPHGENTFIWYNGTHLSNHMASHFRIKWSSWSRTWELQTSHYILISLITDNK